MVLAQGFDQRDVVTQEGQWNDDASRVASAFRLRG
jgi:hypothetical protein